MFRCMLCDKMRDNSDGRDLTINRELIILVCPKCLRVVSNYRSIVAESAGSRSTPKKRLASAKNGKLGGRPRNASRST